MGGSAMRIIDGGMARKTSKAIQDDSSLEVACPVCEALPKEPCHVQAGVVRFESHLERAGLANERKIERLDSDKVLTLLAARQHLGKGVDS
jgi:hypothetical protein